MIRAIKECCLSVYGRKQKILWKPKVKPENYNEILEHFPYSFCRWERSNFGKSPIMEWM